MNLFELGFQINDGPIFDNILSPEQATVVLAAGQELSGIFADGTPFSFDIPDDDFFSADRVTVRLVETLGGDFDFDGDADGADFLEWQRTDRTALELAAWQLNYGLPQGGPTLVSTTVVPEPSTLVLLLGSMVFFSTLRSPKVNR